MNEKTNETQLNIFRTTVGKVRLLWYFFVFYKYQLIAIIVCNTIFIEHTL